MWLQQHVHEYFVRADYLKLGQLLLQQTGYPISNSYKAMFLPLPRIILVVGERSGAVYESTAIEIPA
jgi:hypothetical protein